MALAGFHEMLVKLKVRKSDYAVDLSILEDPVDLERLAIVVECYHSNSYLKSFGYRKVKITEEINASHAV
jgi:hypothetical protein